MFLCHLLLVLTTALLDAEARLSPRGKKAATQGSIGRISYLIIQQQFSASIPPAYRALRVRQPEHLPLRGFN
jgi:hypothetical protein